MPSLKDAEIVAKRTGLRPMRIRGVRLEMEFFVKEHRISKVIHNYGHSSQGVILSWGSADVVRELIEKDMRLKDFEIVSQI